MWNPLSKKIGISNSQQRSEESADRNSIFFQTLEKKRHEDPLISAKIGAKEVFHRLIELMKKIDAKGIHADTLLCILGTLAGYSCQASLRSEFVEEKGMSEKVVFTIIGCADGSQYFFGDMVNKPLAENQYSVWALATGTVKHLGVQQLININDIFSHVVGTVGSNNFGIPRIPEGHNVGDLPQNYLKHLWPVFLPVAKQFCPASEWPILFGLAVQEGIVFCKDVIDPLLALSIVMECAVPMAKIDFNSL